MQVYFEVFIKKNKIISIVLHKRLKTLRFVGQKECEMTKKEKVELERLLDLTKGVIEKALHIGENSNAVSVCIQFLDKLKGDLGIKKKGAKNGEKESKEE